MKRTFESHAALSAWASGPEASGKVWHVMVLHDAQCSPSRCQCGPSYQVELATEENLVEGARLERAWARDTRS